MPQEEGKKKKEWPHPSYILPRLAAMSRAVEPAGCENVAETASLCEAVKETVWLRGILDSLGFEQPMYTPLYEDNNGVIALARGGGGFHDKTKHIATRTFRVYHAPTPQTQDPERRRRRQRVSQSGAGTRARPPRPKKAKT